MSILLKNILMFGLFPELTIYYRNFDTWLSKFGFYGKYDNGLAYITDIGFFKFLNSYDNERNYSAIFLNQIKKIQVS